MKKKCFHRVETLFLVSVLFIFSIALAGCKAATIAHNFKDLISDGEYSEAKIFYLDNIVEDGDTSTAVNEYLSEYVSEALLKYQNGEWDYTTSVYRIENVSDYPSISEQASSALKIINEDHDSELAYQDAKLYYEAGEYTSAIKCFDNVSPNCRSYSEAMDFKDQIVSTYRESILSSSSTLLEQEEYLDAIDLVDEALSLLPKDTDLSTQRTKIIAAKQKHDTEYEKDMLATAEAFASKNNFESAIRTLTEAAAVLGDNRFEESISEYSKRLPKGIDELKIIQKGAVDIIRNSEDTFGNKYEVAALFNHFDSEIAYALINTDGYFNNFSAVIAVYDRSTDTVVDRPFEVYADGVLVYKTTITPTTAPINVDIEIDNCQQLRINGACRVIAGNIKFYNKLVD